MCFGFLHRMDVTALFPTCDRLETSASYRSTRSTHRPCACRATPTRGTSTSAILLLASALMVGSSVHCIPLATPCPIKRMRPFSITSKHLHYPTIRLFSTSPYRLYIAAQSGIYLPPLREQGTSTVNLRFRNWTRGSRWLQGVRLRNCVAPHVAHSTR